MDDWLVLSGLLFMLFVFALLFLFAALALSISCSSVAEPPPRSVSAVPPTPQRKRREDAASHDEWKTAGLLIGAAAAAFIVWSSYNNNEGDAANNNRQTHSNSDRRRIASSHSTSPTRSNNNESQRSSTGADDQDVKEYELYGNDASHLNAIREAAGIRKNLSSLNKTQRKTAIDKMRNRSELPSIHLRLHAIKHTQRSIQRYFTDGSLVSDLVTTLKENPLYINNVPQIRVVFYDRNWWSLDNRRLLAFQRALPLEMKISVEYLCTELTEFHNKRKNGRLS